MNLLDVPLELMDMYYRDTRERCWADKGDGSVDSYGVRLACGQKPVDPTFGLCDSHRREIVG